MEVSSLQILNLTIQQIKLETRNYMHADNANTASVRLNHN